MLANVVTTNIHWTMANFTTTTTITICLGIAFFTFFAYYYTKIKALID